MANAITFYCMDVSSCSRMVRMVLEELGLKYDPCFIRLGKREHLTEEFRNINPAQTLPAIKDGDFYLAESRAIATYLLNQYGEKCGKQSLYPVDPKQRAVVDQHLYISATTWQMFSRYTNVKGILDNGETSVKHDLLDGVRKTLQLVEETLMKRKYIAADHLTLADFFYYVNMSFLDLIDFDEFENYPRIKAWCKMISELAYNRKVNEEPHAKLKKFYKEVKARNATNGFKK